MKTATIAAGEMERAIVAGLMLRPEALYELPAGFDAGALLNPVLARAFAATERLARAKKPTDLVLVGAEAHLADGELSVLGNAIAAYVPGEPIREYAERLLDMARRRRLQGLLREAAQSLDGEAGTSDVVGKLTASLLDLDASERPETVSYREALLSTIDAVERVKTGKAKVLRTGLEQLDGVLRVRPGNLVILAARPKIGKSTLARQIARTVATRGQHVAWHGLEMDAPETVTLDLSAGAGIDSLRFFDDAGGFSDGEWARITTAADKLCPGDADGFLHANHYHHGLGAICRITEKLHRKHTLSLVVVDYLQLVQCDLGKGATRENVVSTISRTLKLLAMRLGVPVLALSQLNRESAKRGDWKPKPKGRGRMDPMRIGADGTPDEGPETPLPPPQLHDLRESGAIEQDANAVVFLHHPWAESRATWRRDHGPFDLIVAAQRLGPKGTVKLLAEREFSRFAETKGAA